MISKRAVTVLAVGATGSIGRHVVAEALRQGHAVRALVRDASQAGQLPPAAKVVTGDLTRADTAALVQGDAPLTRDPRLDVHAALAHNAVRRDVGPGARQTRNLRLVLGQSIPPIRLPRPVSMGLRPRSRLTTGRTASAATPSRRAGSTRTSASPPSVRCRTRPCAAGARWSCTLSAAWVNPPTSRISRCSWPPARAPSWPARFFVVDGGRTKKRPFPVA